MICKPAKSYSRRLLNTRRLAARGGFKAQVCLLARNFSYDKVGNLVSCPDARRKSLQLAHDSMNRSTRMANPVGDTYKLDYNAQSLPITVTDDDGGKAEHDH